MFDFMNQPLVSVCMTAYNVDKFIAEAIESVFNQSASFFKIELVILDDCSSDNTIEIINSYPFDLMLL